MNLIQQKLMIKVLLKALVGAMMTHEIGDFQTHPPRLLIKGETGGKEEVQDQRTHMTINKFLKTFLCKNFLKKKSGLPSAEGGIPETPTPENMLSEEDQEKVLKQAEKDIKRQMAECKSKSSFGAKKDQLKACQSF